MLYSYYNQYRKEDPLPGEFTPDIISGQTTLLANGKWLNLNDLQGN